MARRPYIKVDKFSWTPLVVIFIYNTLHCDILVMELFQVYICTYKIKAAEWNPHKMIKWRGILEGPPLMAGVVQLCRTKRNKEIFHLQQPCLFCFLFFESMVQIHHGKNLHMKKKIS